MRWEIIKKAWAMAKDKFPDAKRLYVDLPDKFRGFGECSVIDLEDPTKPLGKIVYEAKCEGGKPVLSMKLDEKTVEASLPRFKSLQVKTASVAGSLKAAAIDAKAVCAKYPDQDTLSQQVAYLIAGHEYGLVKEAGTDLHEGIVETWIVEQGFPREVTAAVQIKLEGMGVKIAKKKKRQFKNYEKVRVVDPRIIEHNEGAQILDHRRDKKKNDWYQVLVDGSDKPIWLNELQLAKNNVGSVSDVSSVKDIL